MYRLAFHSVASGKRKPPSLDQLLQSSHQLLTKYRTGRLEDARNATSLIEALGQHGHSPVAVNTSLDLIFKSHPSPILANTVLKQWKELSKTKPNLTLSYDTIVSKLPKSSQDDTTTSLLLTSVLLTKGLEAAEEFLRQRRSTVFLLNQLLKAYVENNAVDKMEQLLSTDLPPDKRDKHTVSILLSYYSSRGMYQEARDLLSLHSDIDVDETVHVQRVSIHVHQEEFQEAIGIIHSKIHNSKNMGIAAQYVLRAFRKQLSERNRKEAVDAAKDFYASIESKMRDDPESNDKLLATLLDTFTVVRRKKDFEKAVSKVKHPNVIHYSIMMKHYKFEDQAERALELLKHVLDKDDETLVSIGLFNNVLDSLVSSSLPDPITKAMETFQLLLHHPRCQMVGLKPNKATFGCLVRFFVAAGKSAEPLLHTMKAHNITPDTPLLASAAASCLKERNLVACERVLAQMDSLGVHAYQNIAKQAFPEEISLEEANEMRDLIVKKESQLSQPFALNLVLAVWSLVKSPVRFADMRKLVKELNLPNDGKTYSLLILTLSRSRRITDVAIAEEFVLRSHRTKTAFVHVRDGYLRLNNPSRAARLLVLQHEMGVSPNGFDVFTVVKEYLNQNMVDEAFALVEDTKRLISDFPLPQNAMEHLAQIDDIRAKKLAALFQA